MGGQINILLHWLLETIQTKQTGKDQKSVITMTKIIRKHQKIIHFSQNVDNLYSYITLLQFASNTVMICSLGFLIVTVSKIIKISRT